jgi:hypothetical protein
MEATREDVDGEAGEDDVRGDQQELGHRVAQAAHQLATAP